MGDLFINMNTILFINMNTVEPHYKDTLGPDNLSTVERLSTIQRWKMY